MIRKLFTLLLALCAAWSVCAQDKADNSIGFGISSRFTTLSDQCIGAAVLQGFDIGIELDYTRHLPKYELNIAGSAAIGNLSSYDFADVKNRMGNQYFARLSAGYMHRINTLKAGRIFIYAGAKATADIHANQILIFSNSQSNYFCSVELAPQIKFYYNLKNVKKGATRFYLELNVPVMAVVFRPGYTVPFTDDEWIPTKRFAWLDQYFELSCKTGVLRKFRNGNTIEGAYFWEYSQYTYQNTVKQAFHGISFMFRFDM